MTEKPPHIPLTQRKNELMVKKPHALDGMAPMSAKQGWLTAGGVVVIIGAIWNLDKIARLVGNMARSADDRQR